TNVLFSVRDSGDGIAESDIKRIFEKFYQADTSHKNEGNGLGLALVKRIVAIHCGHIEAENCMEGGCKFTVVLPVKNLNNS
ncbi:MAG: sensor histidine kinase, partial [Clostridium sp.]|nr:sensor histidine kinase [Clostridium sp.]